MSINKNNPAASHTRAYETRITRDEDGAGVAIYGNPRVEVDMLLRPDAPHDLGPTIITSEGGEEGGSRRMNKGARENPAAG